MSRECEDNRRLDILVSVKAQVPLKYFWRIEVVGHLDIAGLKISRIIRLFRDLVARSLDPRKFPLYFRLFIFSKGSNTFSRLFRLHNTLLLLQISFTRTTDNFLRLEEIELRKP